jgi:anti-anti-sigma factor
LRLLSDKADGGSAIKSDSPIFETAQRDRREDHPILVKLSGEIDVRYQKILDDTMSDCLASGRSTFVDLSGVTFMDSRCVRELALHYQLGNGRVALCDPSWEVELGVAACDLEEWIDFVYTTGLGRSARRCRGERLPQGSNKIEERN